jgi:hypothetical protein
MCFAIQLADDAFSVAMFARRLAGAGQCEWAHVEIGVGGIERDQSG